LIAKPGEAGSFPGFACTLIGISRVTQARRYNVDAAQVRQLARQNEWPGSTRSAAPGQVQCNIAILPGEDASEFHEWCRANPGVAPVLAISGAGDPSLPALGEGIDIRRDLPAYRVSRLGRFEAEVNDIVGLWGDDWQAFAFGCSFSLEDVLRANGVPLAYEERGFGGAIYRTAIETVPCGGFGGQLIVSMRPIDRDAVPQAIRISNLHPGLHGGPVHIGDPSQIGIDLRKPLEALGEVSILPSEEPVFWACGVTAHLAIERAKPRIAVTHVSSRMLVTDLTIESPLCRKQPFARDTRTSWRSNCSPEVMPDT
jgi:uncharacterized protein YcsI (UPF0317 family)